MKVAKPQTWASRRAICAIRRLFCACIRCISSAIRRRSSCNEEGLDFVRHWHAQKLAGDRCVNNSCRRYRLQEGAAPDAVADT